MAEYHFERALFVIGDQNDGKTTRLKSMARLGMTESELFAAAFSSKKVGTALGSDSNGGADILMFEFIGDDIPYRGKH
jgi:hypothetical protein